MELLSWLGVCFPVDTNDMDRISRLVSFEVTTCIRFNRSTRVISNELTRSTVLRAALSARSIALVVV
jgi:hypothetical protein